MTAITLGLPEVVVSPALVRQAYRVIEPQIIRTPLISSPKISSLASRLSVGSFHSASSPPQLQLYLKCENFQRTGSFKFRGAAHSLACLRDDELGRGILTTSSGVLKDRCGCVSPNAHNLLGNHARALAESALQMASLKRFDIPVFVVMPQNASTLKIQAVRALGAKVVISGSSWQEREAAVDELSRTHNLTIISPSDNVNVMLGHGTMAHEMVDQMQSSFDSALDCVIAPCGGGGMLSGIAVALKNHNIKVFGAEPSEGADDALRSIQQGQRIDRVVTSTIADGLRCPLSPLSWQVIQRPDLVHGVFTATDRQIRAAMYLVWRILRMVVEPSAAVPLAVVLFNEKFRNYAAKQAQPLKVGIVFSGGNYSRARDYSLAYPLESVPGSISTGNSPTYS